LIEFWGKTIRLFVDVAGCESVIVKNWPFARVVPAVVKFNNIKLSLDDGSIDADVI
jgi:hypothetical protein